MGKEWQVVRDPGGFLALGLGLGLMPWMPGTFGALLAFPLIWSMSALGLWAKLAIVVALALVGIGICGRAGQLLGKPDHGAIVWDELCGCALAMLFVPATWLWWGAAFVAFRVFDIAKPFPISWLDDHVEGGLGVMADDMAAGVAAGLLLLAASYVLS